MTGVLIYTKPDCIYCEQAKLLLSEKNMSYDESRIGRDILREHFKELFPDQKTAPLIFIEGQKIGGYEQLVEYFNNKPQMLCE